MDVTIKYKDDDNIQIYNGIWEIQDNKTDYFLVELNHYKKQINKNDIEYIMIKK